MIFVTCEQNKKIKFTMGRLYWNGSLASQVGSVRVFALYGDGEGIVKNDNKFELIPNTGHLEDQSFMVEVDVQVPGNGIECLTEQIVLRPVFPDQKKLYIDFGAPEVQ